MPVPIHFRFPVDELKGSLGCAGLRAGRFRFSFQYLFATARVIAARGLAPAQRRRWRQRIVAAADFAADVIAPGAINTGRARRPPRGAGLTAAAGRRSGPSPSASTWRRSAPRTPTSARARVSIPPSPSFLHPANSPRPGSTVPPPPFPPSGRTAFPPYASLGERIKDRPGRARVPGVTGLRVACPARDPRCPVSSRGRRRRRLRRRLRRRRRRRRRRRPP